MNYDSKLAAPACSCCGKAINLNSWFAVSKGGAKDSVIVNGSTGQMFSTEMLSQVVKQQVERRSKPAGFGN